jgi:lipoprotein-anchoring transpeptidase ErfK/SrfK
MISRRLFERGDRAQVVSLDETSPELAISFVEPNFTGLATHPVVLLSFLRRSRIALDASVHLVSPKLN